MSYRLFWLGVILVAAAGIAAALLGPWWAALANGLIVVGLVTAHRRAVRQLRIAEAHLKNTMPVNGHHKI